MVQMFGWLSAEAARASCSKRADAGGILVSSAGSSLSATCPSEVEVTGEPHLAHATGAEGAHDLIGVQPRAGAEGHVGVGGIIRPSSEQERLSSENRGALQVWGMCWHAVALVATLRAAGTMRRCAVIGEGAPVVVGS